MKNIIKIALLLCIASMAFAVYGQNSRTTDEGVVINGIRWATRNVDKPGTFTEKPEDAGMFYQFNHKDGWSSTDPLVNSDGGSEWNRSIMGIGWSQENNPCPCGWRVPTKKEFNLLVDSNNSFWSELNGVSGRFFGSSESPIFLPASGLRDGRNGSLHQVGMTGTYWSSSPMGHFAYVLCFGKKVSADNNFIRSLGFSVRCVAE